MIFGKDSPGADSEEKHEPAGDIDTAVVDSLKALDPKRPIREADMRECTAHIRFRGKADIGRQLPISICEHTAQLSFRLRHCANYFITFS